MLSTCRCVHSPSPYASTLGLCVAHAVSASTLCSLLSLQAARKQREAARRDTRGRSVSAGAADSAKPAPKKQRTSLGQAPAAAAPVLSSQSSQQTGSQGRQSPLRHQPRGKTGKSKDASALYVIQAVVKSW